jgi:endonuclease/exonuclease/phosphatase family metal-dependent hydrolase
MGSGTEENARAIAGYESLWSALACEMKSCNNIKLMRVKMRRQDNTGQDYAHGGFSVASYNIHKYVGIDGVFAPERIALVIKELKADIVGLQEIESSFYRNENLAGAIREKAGMEMIFGPTRRNRDGHYGNALLTAYPVKDVRRINLSVFGRSPRGALDVDLLVKGETIRVIVAHLGLGLRERRKQIRRLLDILCLERDRMAIMLGDFNEWVPFGSPLRRVHSAFGKSPTLRTFPSLMPVLPLDRIWIHPVGALASMSTHKTPLSRRASDHLPVKAFVVPNGKTNGNGGYPA